MSLKEALLKHKQQLDEIKQEIIEKQQAERLQMMLAQQQCILDSCEDHTPPQVEIKKEVVDYSFKPEVLSQGGSCYYHTTIGDANGVAKKRKFRISVTSDTNDVVLKYHTRIANGERFSVNAKSYSEAQLVTDELFSKLYRVSGTVV